MANFALADKKTLAAEGGYADNPADFGGETFRGIASVFHPRWAGWPSVRTVVQTIKSDYKQPLDSSLSSDHWRAVNARIEASKDVSTLLSTLVSDFYQEEFWDRLGLSAFSSQLLAELVYDAGVNAGTGRAGLWLQQALNYLNVNQTLQKDLEEDGAVGPNTIKAATNFQRSWPRKLPALCAAFLVLRGNFHLESMKKRPDQEIFATSWLSRIAKQMGEIE